MKAIVLGAKNYVGKEHIYPSQDVFSAIGNLSFEQASTLRHRGALTAVSQMFTTSCQMSRHYRNDNSSESLLHVWYQVGILPESSEDSANTCRVPLIASSPKDPPRGDLQVFRL